MSVDIPRLRSLLDAATLGPFIAEPDDSFDNASIAKWWRLISAQKRKEWRRYLTTARVPYVATVYTRDDAVYMRELLSVAPDLIREIEELRALVRSLLEFGAGGCEWSRELLEEAARLGCAETPERGGKEEG